ncbi:MAG: peptidyl-tRNA hydrolase [Myxococcaceae bacterium]|nr:peptidyl-tRNA hydrolase [Myxococcaceae bacterium]
MKLVVGLGNPGNAYRYHRHNVGFMALDALSDRHLGSEWREKNSGLFARAMIAGRDVALLKPQSFMNLSGRAVLKTVQSMGLKPADILVVHDELELPFAELRAKQGGGHGGHNGLRDITATIGAEYARLRVGIGRPAVGAVDAYVLAGFDKEQAGQLDALLARAVEVIELAVGQGIQAAIDLTTKPQKKK